MESIVSMMNLYGESATIQKGTGEEVSVFAFFEPASKSEVKLCPSPIGQRFQDCYTYIGPPDIAVGGCTLVWRGRTFGASHGHLVYLGGEPCHYWALLSPRGENAL